MASCEHNWQDCRTVVDGGLTGPVIKVCTKCLTPDGDIPDHLVYPEFGRRLLLDDDGGYREVDHG